MASSAPSFHSNRRRILALAIAGAALLGSAQADAATRGKTTRTTRRADQAKKVTAAPVKVPRRSRQASAHRAYLQAKEAGIIAPAGGSAVLPGGVKEAVSAGITDSNGAAGGLDNITLVTSGSGKGARSYFAGNRYKGVATRKTGETFEVHGPFRVDEVGTLEGADPVVSTAGVNAKALARETGVDVEVVEGRSEKPSWFGRSSRTVLARGDEAVRQFHSAHLDRSIHRTSAARALNALAGARALRNPRLIRFSQSSGGISETVDVLVFSDGAGGRYRIIGN